MKRLIVLFLMTCLDLVAMEPKDPQDISKDAEKRVVTAMLDAAKSSYEKAFKVIDALDPKQLNHETIAVLKRLATEREYRDLLRYAFDTKKILPTDELASSLLVEAARKHPKIDMFSSISIKDDIFPIPLQVLLGYGVDPNKPGKLLVHESRNTYSYTPLVVAVIKGRHLNVQFLLAHGANPNGHLPHENLPLVEAFTRFHTWFRRYEPSFENSTGLLYCSYQNIEYQLKQKGADERQDNGKDISLKDFEGRAPCRTVWEMKGRLGYNGI